MGVDWVPKEAKWAPIRLAKAFYHLTSQLGLTIWWIFTQVQVPRLMPGSGLYLGMIPQSGLMSVTH